MEFEIRITHERTTMLRAPEGKVGVMLLDRAREETGVPLLALERVHSEIPAFRRNSIWLARASGLFKFTDEILVLRREVLPAEDYIHLRLEIARDNETGEIKSAGFIYEVDEALILADWIAAGYPTTW